jgi:hypothetical protein
MFETIELVQHHFPSHLLFPLEILDLLILAGGLVIA